eukprot:240842-Prorocentrum_minimum.AAC.1
MSPRLTELVVGVGGRVVRTSAVCRARRTPFSGWGRHTTTSLLGCDPFQRVGQAYHNLTSGL